ncbi:MAG TPA: class I SAM-dependent methyltransferase [Acidimicrobiales bacterium]|jgi:SAM-dependent methyltransferase|nr:class I SAM-dependent methyltransferase [Acidimicrobiales bacterium]
MGSAAEEGRWNDDFWTGIWPRRERLTSSVTGFLLRHLAPAPGERILDVGSGGGLATLEMAAAVGAAGRVVGADISRQLVELATRRAADAQAGNVTFVRTDVQAADVAGAPFDAVTSQFGVMFFDEPVRAFTRLAAQTAPGGRLAFACWQDGALNPWNVGAVLARFAPPAPEPGPGRSTTGPFVFGDAAYTSDLLEEAGWSAVACHPYRQEAVVDRVALFDEGELEFRAIPVSRRRAAMDAVEERLAPLATGDGRIAAPLAFQIFTAARA